MDAAGDQNGAALASSGKGLSILWSGPQQGNFEGRSVLSIEIAMEEIASRLKIPLNDFRNEIVGAKKILFEKRKERAAPFKDDKILSSWNALMVHALARAGIVLQKKEYTAQALLTIKAIRSLLWEDLGTA